MKIARTTSPVIGERAGRAPSCTAAAGRHSSTFTVLFGGLEQRAVGALAGSSQRRPAAANRDGGGGGAAGRARPLLSADKLHAHYTIVQIRLDYYFTTGMLK
ncbi:hypothetical protein EVAR_98304_1 [Eumeta japonica]|uniref:Uncharacterized protein n=1 Tax=Eumeta variegata TaxID=151549 RepID=A0A4C1X9B3_EUMVA|nr:hypothetical protein EVAR_98304_1 [Eumeta japonica]